jgi:hypothetical protein
MLDSASISVLASAAISVPDPAAEAVAADEEGTAELPEAAVAALSPCASKNGVGVRGVRGEASLPEIASSE